MTHPSLDELGADSFAPEVLVHLDQCAECRDARSAWLDCPTPPDRTLPTATGDDRFTILGPLGRGGMGDVYLGRDETLDREVAIKVLRPDRLLPDAHERLLREARLTAVLQHPAIVPIHRVGRLADGRPFYVMKRVDGQPLRELLASPIPRRRAVGFVARACDAIAFAHAAGVIHGDLKPENVLIGGFDELTLLDFGLALRIGSPRSSRAGTPPYLAPEIQAGSTASTGADVYAVGALLCEVLTGSATVSVDLEDVPSPLAAACRAATSLDPDARPTAGELAHALRRWLDGERRTEEARVRLASAGEARARADDARTLARSLRHLAEEELAQVPPYEALEKKIRPWAFLDQADEAEAAAHEADLDLLQALMAALELDPELPEARRELAGYHQARLVEAERRGDLREIRRSRRTLEADPVTRAWLAAPAVVEVRTAVPGARVVAFEPRVEARQWRIGAERELGSTPVRAELPPGRWRIEVHQNGRAAAIFAARLARESTVSMELDPPEPVPGTAWVPPGWFGAGGDEDSMDGLSARRVWVDGFHLQLDPVTVTEYVRFLNAVPRDEAARHQPLETAGFGSDPRPVLRRSEGDFVAEPSRRDSVDWEADWPVVLVDYAGASAYAAWWSAETGRTWRLPHDLEWEKAARGDDGRTFPWGDRLDPSFANVQKAIRGTPRRSAVGEFPLDVSPYGIRGLGGNVRDWCCNAYRREGDAQDGERLEVRLAGPDAPYVMVRGGSWTSAPNVCRSATRFGSAPDYRVTSVGFRLVRVTARSG